MATKVQQALRAEQDPQRGGVGEIAPAAARQVVLHEAMYNMDRGARVVDPYIAATATSGVVPRSAEVQAYKDAQAFEGIIRDQFDPNYMAAIAAPEERKAATQTASAGQNIETAPPQSEQVRA